MGKIIGFDEVQKFLETMVYFLLLTKKKNTTPLKTTGPREFASRR